MKFNSTLIIICLLLFLPVSGYSLTKVKFFMGDVQYIRKNSTEWQNISASQRLGTGDTVKTGKGSYAEIDHNGHYIKLHENSRFKLSQSAEEGKSTSSISMFFGNLTARVKRLAKGEQFNSTTPSATCAVRGTEFLIAAGHDGKTLVQVTKGAVALKGETKEVTIKSNQESSVDIGGDPTKVKILKKRAWNKWAEQSKKNIKGNEEKILRACLTKIEKLDNEIILLEGEVEKSKKLSTEYREKAIIYKKKKDKKNLKKYARLAHTTNRSGYSALTKIFFKADKMELIKEVATGVYEQAVENKSQVEPIYSRIEEIFNKNYNKYIYKIKDSDKMREDIRKRKKTKK